MLELASLDASSDPLFTCKLVSASALLLVKAVCAKERLKFEFLKP
jgi:hypothetical protein